MTASLGDLTTVVGPYLSGTAPNRGRTSRQMSGVTCPRTAPSIAPTGTGTALTGFQQGMHEYEDEADGIAAALQLPDGGVHGGVDPIAACQPVDRVAKGQERGRGAVGRVEIPPARRCVPLDLGFPDLLQVE